MVATLSSSSSFSQTNCQEARQKYWILYPDVANAKFDPYQHYQIHGKNEGRIWPACRGEEQDCEKAKSQYYKLYPDVYNAGANAWTHYQTYGFKEGRVWPFSKCEPSLEAVSIATLKKWKSNPIEDDNRKGEKTFTFSPDNVNSAQENASTSNIITNEIKQKDKYYSVSHNSWGEFMNKYAVWVDNKVKANEGKNTALEFSFSLLESKIYDIEVAGDDNAEIYFDGELLSKVSNWTGSDKFKLLLKSGKYTCSVKLFNIPSGTSKWNDNPTGFGMIISENSKVVFSTRDNEFICKEATKYYPVNHPPFWNHLLNQYAVWINNKENNHEGEWKELSFQTTMLQSGFYNFEISADDTAEFILDGKKIMDISYQKGIHDFNIRLDQGVHHLQLKVMNFTLNKSNWEENAVGAAILVKDNMGNIVFSTRENKYCYDNEDKISDLKLPWGLVNIWYNFNQPTLMSSFSIDIEVMNEIPEDCNLYIAPFGLGKINNVTFYGGIQTNIGGSKRIIFSRWGERSTEAIQTAEGGYYESAGYEGDFISVRNLYKWSKGKYKLTLFSTDKHKMINSVLHTFVGMKIQSYNDYSEKIAGYLAFPGDNITLDNNLNIFVELYGTTIHLSKVPRFIITLSNFKINNRFLEIPQMSAYYPNKWPHMAAASFVKGKLRITIGEKVQRQVDQHQEYSVEKIK